MCHIFKHMDSLIQHFIPGKYSPPIDTQRCKYRPVYYSVSKRLEMARMPTSRELVYYVVYADCARERYTALKKTEAHS